MLGVPTYRVVLEVNGKYEELVNAEHVKNAIEIANASLSGDIGRGDFTIVAIESVRADKCSDDSHKTNEGKRPHEGIRK